MLTCRLLRTVLLLVAIPGALSAQRLRQGFAPDRLARIDRFLQQSVDSNRVAGAVGLIIRDGRVVYERAIGWSDREGTRRMTPDAIFRIASQSKAITSTAVLMLLPALHVRCRAGLCAGDCRNAKRGRYRARRSGPAQ